MNPTIETLKEAADGLRGNVPYYVLDSGYAPLEKLTALIEQMEKQEPVKKVYAVAADQTLEGRHQLYTITDSPIPMADNWALFTTPQPCSRCAALEAGIKGLHSKI